MTNIKSQLIDRMSKSEKEIFTEFVKVFPLDGHEPDQQGFIFNPQLSKGRLDNDGLDDNSTIFISRENGDGVELFRFNVATLLALAKFGFEEGLKQ